jgi:hypothetical protein
MPPALLVAYRPELLVAGGVCLCTDAQHALAGPLRHHHHRKPPLFHAPHQVRQAPLGPFQHCQACMRVRVEIELRGTCVRECVRSWCDECTESSDSYGCGWR